MTIFDWTPSKLGERAQSCDMHHEGHRYWLTASETLRKGEFQAMCNGVRVCKTFYATVGEAKACCEKWYKREVLRLTASNG